MRDFFTHIVDFIFPPSPEALELRSLSPEDATGTLPKAPPPPLPFITSLFAYKNPLVRELIWSIKYKKDRHSLKIGGYALHQALQEGSVLVPIPISAKRRRERGYNQCELLIDEIVKLDTEGRFEKRFDILKRNKHTDRQTLKNRKERLESTEHLFSAVSVPLSYPIILIDDVTTTGSTLREAQKTLLEAGYGDVRALTLAH